MIVCSTRNGSETATFREAVLRGPAPDGGLYIPAETPDLSDRFAALPPTASFAEVAGKVLEPLLSDEFTPKQIGDIVDRAFPFAPVLRRLDDTITLLELFHGPSAAFKDYGASFLATLMDHYLAQDSRRAIVLTATSGDTGSAVARAFAGASNIDVVVLFPAGRISALQEAQMTTIGGNVTAVEVLGSFDDCQRMVKGAFADEELRGRLPLTSANSINLGRLLPQSIYYVYAAVRAGATQRPSTEGTSPAPIHFCVPSGNFGNLTAGVLAKLWGLPVGRFIAATNRNDVVPEYLREGVYRPRPSVATPANAMDVGDPSNLERLRRLLDDDIDRLRNLVVASAAGDDEIYATMREVYEDHELEICPHTAAGVFVARRLLSRDLPEGASPAVPAGHPVVVAATAHPGKFSEAFHQATGRHPTIPPRLAAMLGAPSHKTTIAAEGASLKRLLMGVSPN